MQHSAKAEQRSSPTPSQAGAFAGPKVADLHARASAWFEANGWIGEAISHALAGEDWERAARLMEQNVQEFVARGQLSQVMGWIEALPSQVARDRPRLGIELAWALTFASQVQKAAPFLQDADTALDAAPLPRGAAATPLERDAGASMAPPTAASTSW